jgi:hypothetical protein
LRWVLGHSHFLVPKPLNAIVLRPIIFIVESCAAQRPTIAHLASNILQIASTHFGIMELHYYGYATSFSNAPYPKGMHLIHIAKAILYTLHMHLDLEDCIR